jgi:hypothetical protein
MNNMAYTVVNLDRMSGTEDSTLLVSLKYFVSENPAEIENGGIVEIGDLIDNEREVRKATAPTASTPITKLVLVANPEIIYDETRHHGLEEYVNEAGKVIRGYRFHSGDGFSMTAEGFSGTPAKGKYLKVGTTTKPVIANDTSTGTIIGKITDVYTLGAHTFYYVDVAL